MITKITTDEVSVDEWQHKLATDDDDWLLRQYYGLDHLVKSIDSAIDEVYHDMKRDKGTIMDDAYKANIYPLESIMMDLDIQLVDVEDEMDKRGLGALKFEGG